MLSFSLLQAAASLLLLLLFPPPTADACGGFFCEPARPVVQSGEAIAFGVDGNKVTMHVQILYEGPAEGFSWLLPLPVPPSNIEVGSDLLFSALFDSTLPQWDLEILMDPNDSCSAEALEDSECFARGEVAEMEEAEMMDDMDEDGAVVLQQGSVGPFDFVVLEAADNNPDSVLEWLNENGYDQPEGSAPLLNYYAVNNHVFVALRLQKQAETGEIQPLILEYTMPEEAGAVQVSRRAMACVPIQLTSIAATDNMPIQVYILGQSRAVPLNFVELQLDDTQVDWLGCNNNPGCHDDNYRERFDRAANQLVNHSFVTEFAGPSQEILQETILIPVTQEEIAGMETVNDFLRSIRFRLPAIDLVDTIVQDYTEDPSSFDAAALAQELEDKVLKPARDAQDFVDSFSYMTRLYARLGPESMTKDPFFAFKPELPTVDNVHRAKAVPSCADNTPTALTITVESSGDSLMVPATFSCGNWIPREPFVWNSSQSAAIQLASWGFEGDEGVVVTRSSDGSFDAVAVQESIAFGDGLVMNQTIPEYVPAASDATPSSTGGEDPTPAPDSSAAAIGRSLQFVLLVLCSAVSLLL